MQTRLVGLLGRPTRQAGQEGRQANKAGRPRRQAGQEGRQAKKAGRPRRQAGHQGRKAKKGSKSANKAGRARSIYVPTLTVNTFAAANDRTNKKGLLSL